MITGSQPLMAAAIAAALLRRRPHAQPPRSGCRFAGVVCVVSSSAGAGGGARIDAAVLILVAVACYALATNLAVPLQQRYGAIAVIRRALLVAFALLAIPGVIALTISNPTLGSLAAIVPLGARSTGGLLTFATLVGRAGDPRRRRDLPGAGRRDRARRAVPRRAPGDGCTRRRGLVTAGAVLVGRSRR